MGRIFNKHENLTILTFWSALQLERYVQSSGRADQANGAIVTSSLSGTILGAAFIYSRTQSLILGNS